MGKPINYTNLYSHSVWVVNTCLYGYVVYSLGIYGDLVMARKKKSAGISKEYLNKCKNANNYNDVLALIAPKYREEKVKLMEQYEVIWDKMLSIVEREHNKPFTPDLDY